MSEIPRRQELPAEAQWDTAALYKNEEDWERDFATVVSEKEKIAAFRGTLGASPEQLLAFLNFDERISRMLDKVYLYAALKCDEDANNSFYQGLKQRVQSLAVELGAISSFVRPELLQIDEKILSQWLKQPELQMYRRYFYVLNRLREHTKNIGEEEILALSGEVCAAPRQIFGVLNNTEIAFPKIKTSKGETQLSHGNFTLFLESTDRDTRRNAFSAMYESYGKNKNTLAALLSANVRRNIFLSRARQFPSCLAASLYNEEIPPAVYTSLIKGVREKLPLYHQYLRLRKRALGLEELHLYDTYALLVKDEPADISYDGAVRMVLDGLAPLGRDYIETARQGIAGGWVDVLENQGKRSGAYSSGVYDSMPYMLLNYQPNLNSVFTLAHELGHSMHSFYSNTNQPYIYSGYEIFVAEVASIVNETLLLLHLLNTEKDREKKKQLLCHYLDEFKGTVFRQTMFAEFEKEIHEHAESGGALSLDYFCDTYYRLNKDYFGDEVIVDEDIALEWARIPHFYTSFYVYKYATGHAAATVLATRIFNDGPGSEATSRYLKFLSSGSSQDPVSLLKEAGVDMTKPDVLQEAAVLFNTMLQELETMV